MKIQDIIKDIRTSKVGVFSIAADAKRVVTNATGTMSWVGTLFTRQTVNRLDGDEVITTGNKETNISEAERVLTSLIGKGVVKIRLMNGKMMEGEVEK